MRIPLSHRGVDFRSAVMTGLLVFIAPAIGAQTVTQIIDATGDVTNGLDYPAGIAVDAAGNVCVGGRDSNNAFRITPGGVIEQIIDSTGDGGFNGLSAARWVAVDGSGNFYLTGAVSDNVFRIEASTTCSTGGTPCTITEIINEDGDGSSKLDYPIGVAVGPTGNVFVAGYGSHNAFRIDAPTTCSTGGTPCTITEIID